MFTSKCELYTRLYLGHVMQMTHNLFDEGKSQNLNRVSKKFGFSIIINPLTIHSRQETFVVKFFSSSLHFQSVKI